MEPLCMPLARSIVAPSDTTTPRRFVVPNSIGPPLAVKVWGPFACFTRPEMKVERVTYPVMTPSAARGVLEAIFWKPEFRWRVEEIWVLEPVQDRGVT